MTIHGIGPVATPPSPAGPSATAPAHKPAHPTEMEKAAKEFEGVFVRQLLSAAKLGGSKGEEGYGAMATDALATGIMNAGGLGLTRQIEAALSHTLSHKKVP